MAKYLVTGGAGFIGSHIVTALVNKGASVRVLDNFSTGSLQNLAPVLDEIELVEGDCSQMNHAAEATRGVDVVFHEAALASVSRSLEDPLATHQHCATATLTMLEAARQAGVRRFVYAGSSSAYGDCDQPRKSESLSSNPLSPYAAAKLAGESYCRAYAHSMGLSTVTLRYFNVFGPRQDPNSPYSAVIPRFITTVLRGEQPTVFGNGLQSRDFTYVDNVVHGNLLAAHGEDELVSGKVFNVAHGENTTLLELLGMLGEQLGETIQPIFKPVRAGDVKHSCADTTRSERALGYKPTVDFKTGLLRTLEYYRQVHEAQSLSASAAC